VGYELRALVGRHEVAVEAARAAGAGVVVLPQGFGLVPVTEAMFSRLGGRDVKPFGNDFWMLSGGVEALARRISQAGDIAYLEADFFGGVGGQAAVAWRAGQVRLGPYVSGDAEPPPPLPVDQWAFNRVLRELGADRGETSDEFDAVGLGRHRRTDDWATVAGPVSAV
jgi:hypothetical protein